MATTNLSKEAFLNLAEMYGLDSTDMRHLDEIYLSVNELLKNTEFLDQLDLTEVPTDLLFQPGRE